MAEQIPYGVASSIIVRLASAAFHELGRIYGVRDELESLKNTVESIEAVLLDAEERQERAHAVQSWIRRLRDVLYLAEDLLDEFAIEDTRHKLDAGHKNKVKEVFHSLSPNHVAFRLKIAHKIEKIQKKFKEVVQEMPLLNLSPRVVVVKQSDDGVRRETSSLVWESEIIGRENSKKEIISLLSQPHEKQNVSVSAIVGIGGLGKTTLAQLVYNDVKEQNFFDKCMWVCVSDNFDVKIIVKKMLELLTNSQIGDESLEKLQTMLCENLTDKKYLLVLDDIWSESDEKWDQLRTYLMCGAHGSKVLVTTRSKTVAQTMGVSDPFVLNGLTLEESWSLLKKITFGDDTGRVNQTLELVSKKIAEKCKGVPLAIKTLGGVLKRRSKESEWIDVLQGDFWKLYEKEGSIMPVLKLSYQDLSPQERQCFAYCSLYPKDYEIKKDELIQMWMAHGYLESSTEEGKLMEDVGNQFVKTFLMKSLFQDAQITRNGDIIRFKMHDLIHDLAMHVARNDCCYLDGEAKKVVGTPMHVFLEHNAIHLLGSLDASRLRTLIFPFDPYEEERLTEDELSIISKFKYLRVLKVSGSSVGKLFDSIGKLKHLRYLNLTPCYQLAGPPKSMSNLVYLQTLELEFCTDVEFSTEVVSKLINLRHLNIQSLGVDTFNIDVPRILKAFEDKKEVELRILRAQQVQYKSVTKWLSSLTHIVNIFLCRCYGLQYLPPMECLPFLKSIQIFRFDELEYIYYEEGLTFFPSLEILTIIGCEKLKGWCRMGDDTNSSSHHLSLPSFPHLSELDISWCPMLTSVPPFPNLCKSLELSDCSVEPLEATLNIAAVDFTPLSMLKSLEIGEILGMEKLPRNWMQNLMSLEDLSFTSFPSEGLQEIEVWFKDDVDFLPSLKKMGFFECEDLQALPEGISRFTNSRTLDIYGYDTPLLEEEHESEKGCSIEETEILEGIWYPPPISGKWKGILCWG